MKKLSLIIGMIIGVAFLAGSVNAQTTQAQDKTTKVKTEQTNQKTQGNFVDKDGDGVCDNYQNKGKKGNCAKFVDENGDGICDNCAGNGNCCGKGMMKGKASGMSKSNCCGKGMGQQHRNRNGNCRQTTPIQPEKK